MNALRNKTNINAIVQETVQGYVMYRHRSVVFAESNINDQ